ncbi:CAMK protein kinase [Salpingoeca rosetta]|uniref:CAMK protein kinase n=1 Tax=Salpingoeca rosetta (strain ATCC 50818 / BSB-021) TaxID=946362 RepID=F2U4E4_SALR5|nr:CAMK protein kinase [Salpingoeca rosetta]EGD82510.1 CAMK protein kinase [Salpingoeca rosetta]|eukprot:XP_004995746.1 CAMK protein kinase [Salpingoeca rosetta]
MSSMDCGPDASSATRDVHPGNEAATPVQAAVGEAVAVEAAAVDGAEQAQEQQPEQQQQQQQPAGQLETMHAKANTLDLHSFIAQLPRDPIQAHFEVAEHVGKGSHGTVFRAKHRLSGTPVAIKEVTLTHGARPREVEHLHQEIYYHSLCNHPHIVTLYTVYVNECHSGTVYYFVMELLTGGELFDRLRSARRFTEADASRVTRNITTALQYMHRRGIAHRDLKPENIMLSHKGCDPWDLKIIDFGYARTGPMTTPLGSGFYISPEIIHAYQSRMAYRFVPGRPAPFTYHTQTDMWTLGVIVFVLLTGRPPFKRGQRRWWEDATLRSSILGTRYRFKQEENVSREAQDLVGSLLRVDPKERFTAEEVLLHPWVVGSPELAARHLASPRKLREEEAADLFQQVREDIHQAREQVDHLQQADATKVAKASGSRMRARMERRRKQQREQNDAGSKHAKQGNVPAPPQQQQQQQPPQQQQEP